MLQIDLKKKFIEHLTAKWPSLSSFDLDSLVSEQLLSPFVIELPDHVLSQIKEAALSYNELRENQNYIDSHSNQLNALGIQDPGNKSIMTSFDFHVTENHEIKLIEINTNAAFLALGLEMYEVRGKANPVEFNSSGIIEMIQSEMNLQNKKIPADFKLFITDEAPEKQRLYIEFLVFNEIFKKHGWNSAIIDSAQLPEKYDFIYNRHTDFFLQEEKHRLLKKMWIDRQICVSPNPFDYYLLADKQRMIEWTQPNYLQNLGISSATSSAILKYTPWCLDFANTSREEIWAQRKKVFIKPKRAFGSKQSYKGASISRKIFDELPSEDFLAQEYIPAGEKKFETAEGAQSFKYDLRCYSYMGKIQSVVARVYQGQVTNLRTINGGFAPVIFSKLGT